MFSINHELELYFELKGTPESSRESYARRVDAFVKFLQGKDKSADEAVTRDVQEYILYLKREKGLSAGTINTYISSIRFLFIHALGKEWDKNKIPRMKRVKKLHVVPPREDVIAILDLTTNLKHKAILSLIYGSGLRVSEVTRLKIGDICSKTMRVRVENAKHNTNRYTILSEDTLLTLRAYFKAYRSGSKYTLQDWLFTGLKPEEHVHVKTIKNTIIKLRDRLQLDSRISAHTLRHCFATHSLENGVEPVHLQHMLGHRGFATTAGYLHLTSKSIMGIKSPLDSK